jgi:3-deoxy-D-manno-octulosonic-acid transferase
MPRAVYLADTTGELMGLFGIASVAFVGKSLCAHGSQNMIEPCLCGVPTVVGPYTENFRPVMSDLLAADAILQVKDEAGLRQALLTNLSAEGQSAARALGERARAAVERRRGATDRCARDILRCIGM